MLLGRESLSKSPRLKEDYMKRRPTTTARAGELRITQRVLDEIRRTIGRSRPEQGGMLGGRLEDGIVTEFYFDESARRSGGAYSPDVETVNILLREEWNPAGIRLLGFVHSHPSGVERLSSGDLTYAKKILERNSDLERLLLPLVMAEPDSEIFELLPFAVVRNGDGVEVVEPKLAVIEEALATSGAVQESEALEAFLPQPERQLSRGPRTNNGKIAAVTGHVQFGSLNYRFTKPFEGALFDTTETFRRVHEAYDLDRLAASRIIYVGCGGAAAFAEDLARAGVGEHVFIDPDVVSESNVGTQQVYRRDVGRPKVDCVGERIRDINPNAAVLCCQQFLDDLNDTEFELLALSPVLRGIRPTATLLCGLTDSFPAQTRINRLALKYGLPSLCAQVYERGRGAEVTFTYPGITPACHRCVLRSRYEAYLKQGFQNNVGSDGTPVFATGRLNALKGFVAMAILHHGADHPRWGSFAAYLNCAASVDLNCPTAWKEEDGFLLPSSGFRM